LILRIIIFIEHLLPSRLLHWLAGLAGKLGHKLLKKDRRIAEKNLEIAFPNISEQKKYELARSCFIQSALNLSDSIRTMGIIFADPPLYDVEGGEEMDKYYANYGGGIVITGHIGCFELIPGICVNMGYKVGVVGRRLYDPRIDKILVRQREKMGVFNIPSDAHPRTVITLIKKGYFIGTLMDTFTKSVDGREASFFGRRVRTISAPIALSRLIKRPVLPMSIRRNNGERFILKIRPPIEIPITDNTDRDVAEGIERANRVLEEMIREYPEQWIWYHNRFRT